MLRISVRILCSCLILCFGLGKAAALDETDQEIPDLKRVLQGQLNNLNIQKNFKKSPIQEKYETKLKEANSAQTFNSSYSQYSQNNNNQIQNTVSCEEQQLLPPFDTKLNITLEDMIPDFFKLSANKDTLQSKNGSKISELDSNQVISAFDVLKNILNNETKSNPDSRDWKGCLNKDMELIKMISKSFFPGERMTETLKKKEDTIIASNLQGKTIFRVTPGPTERHNSENGTVKVLVGKWDLDKDKNNKSVSAVTASNVSPNLADYDYSHRTRFPENERMKEKYSTQEMSYLSRSTMDITTAKVTVHVCSKCSKKWGLALKELDEWDYCTCNSQKLDLSSTPRYEDKTKLHSRLTTESDAYLDFIKILDTFSITTEREELQNTWFSPTRSNNNIFISENSTEKRINEKYFPPKRGNYSTAIFYPATTHRERRPTGKEPRVSTMSKEAESFNMAFSQTTSTYSDFGRRPFTQFHSSNSAITDISPTKSKAHMQLVKVFDTTKSLTTAYWENIAYSWNEPSTLIPFKNLSPKPGKENNNVTKGTTRATKMKEISPTTETILPLTTLPIGNKTSVGPNIPVTPTTETVTKKIETTTKKIEFLGKKTPESVYVKTTLGLNVPEESTKPSSCRTETSIESTTNVHFKINTASEDTAKTTANSLKEPCTTRKQIPSTTSIDNVVPTPTTINPNKQSSPALSNSSNSTPSSTKYTEVSSADARPTTLSQDSTSSKHKVPQSTTETSTKVTKEFQETNCSKEIPTTTLTSPLQGSKAECTLEPITESTCEIASTTEIIYTTSIKSDLETTTCSLASNDKTSTECTIEISPTTDTSCTTTKKTSTPISKPTTQSSQNETSSFVGSTKVLSTETNTASSIKSISETLTSTYISSSPKESSTEIYSTTINTLGGITKNSDIASTSEPSSTSNTKPFTASSLVPVKETTKLKELISSTSSNFGSSFSETHQVKTTIPCNVLSNPNTPNFPSTVSFNESFSNESSSKIPSTTKSPNEISPACTAPYTIKSTSSKNEVGSTPPVKSVNNKYSTTLKTTIIEITSLSEPAGLSTPTISTSTTTSTCPILEVTIKDSSSTATTTFPSQPTTTSSVNDTTTVPSTSCEFNTSTTTLSNNMNYTTTSTLNSEHISSKPSVETPSSTIVPLTEYKLESSSKINSTPALTTESNNITSASVTEEIKYQDGSPSSRKTTLSPDHNFPLTTVPIYATRIITENINETISEASSSYTTTTEVTVASVATTAEVSTKPAKDIHTDETPEPNMLEFPNAGAPTSSFDFYGLQPYNSSITVRQYVADISEKAAAINNKNMIAQWNHETNITHKNYKIAMVSTLELIHYQRIQNQFLDTLRDVQVYDPMLEREIKLLYLPGMCILPDIKIAVFEEMLYAMDTIFSSASVIAWNNPHVRYHLPDVKKAMSVSNIPEELSYYWLEWRNVTGRKLRRLYEQYVELMNLTALSNGFCDASEMWTRDYETEDFMQLMGCHWEEIRPLYLELHAYVRCKLHKHYGDVTMTTDYSLPIPAHLVGDLWGQTWKTLFNITRPYEKVYDYPTMDIRSKGYTTTKMALYAEAFFSSLGFPSLPEPFWKNSILTKQKTEMSCEPTAWDMCDGKDFRIKMCSNGTLKDFFDIHHELTHVEYFIQYKDLSFPFRAGPNPGFHEALAGTILLSVENPSHLTQVGLAPKPKSHGSDVDINYLLRVALDKVAFLPYSYIVDLWRYKVFKGDIKPNDYNKRWWELRLQYQGLAPPNHRTEDDFDPGCKFHIAGNKPYIQNFLSTILQFQFHEALCRRAGLINPKTPLHNCDISNSHEAGTILRRVMSMGATQHWRVAMNELTGTRQISSKGLVEFFKPLLAWLRKENMRNGQKIGWKNTINLF